MLARVGVDRSVELVFRELARLVLGGRLELALGRDLGVLRALRNLRDEGLLEFRRGRGITVAGTPERGAVVARARELVRFARAQGYRVDELITIIERLG